MPADMGTRSGLVPDRPATSALRSYGLARPEGRRDTARAMSEENVEIVRGVRTPLTVSAENRRRTLDERIFVLFPALAHVLLSALSRLPPRSRLRRAWLPRIFRQAFEAANRRDFNLLVLGLDPEIEYQANENALGGFVAPDLLGVHHGHDGYLHIWEVFTEALEDLKLEPEEVIDFGDRVLVSGRMTGHGTSSGIPVSGPLFQIFTLRRGLVIRQEDFSDRDKALEAAGLEE
jgi:ketosteroid isomerase-like protein